MRGRAARPVVLVEPEARRAFNDDRRRVFAESARAIAFVCECSDAECRASVVLTKAEYDEARPGPIVAARHSVGK